MAKVAKASRKTSSGTLAKQSVPVRIEASMTEKQAEVRNEKETAMYRKFVPQVEKRDGTIIPFEFDKIVQVIHKAMIASSEGSYEEARAVAHRVMTEVVRVAKKYKNFLPTVEGFQDSIEKELILSDYVATSKAYILYRDQRTKLRKQGVVVPDHVKKLADESANYFKDNPLGEFVYLRTYSRWIDAEGRRETWIETVNRYVDFMKENLTDKLTAKEYEEVRQAILNHEAMPSMRLLQFAGPAVRKCNVAAYNCSFVAPSKIEDFAETMYASMSGAGVGFSVESQSVQALPQIATQSGDKLPVHVVADSREGWCDALTLGLKTWYDGKDVTFDYSEVRPAGARLKTTGGKASGPAPLRSLLDFAREKILTRQGRRLRNIDVHDILCKIGECVMAGGVRRSAMISLSDLDDEMMRDAKKGQFYLTEMQRSMANNSAVYDYKPTNTEFLDEWVALMKSGSGERGIFNRGSLYKQLPGRRTEVWQKDHFMDEDGHVKKPVGTNPCGEIILRSKQFCNLTEVVARKSDTEASLLRKVRIATILGTYQSSLVNFKYLSKEWKDNCERERLLGVSITGQWDSPAVRDPKILEKMRTEAVKVNQKFAKRFGISQSTSITCVKPSGTLSQTVNCSSGMHPRHAPYYIRRIRISATDALFKMLKDQGVPYHPEVGQVEETANTFVLDFPVKSPEGSIYKNDLSAIDQLEHWKIVKTKFTEHNPSITVSVGDDEWIAVGNWVYENWDIVGGLSFLPRSNHVYQLAPYEEITREQYDSLIRRFDNLDFSKIVTYEIEDETENKKELACAGGTCEI